MAKDMVGVNKDLRKLHPWIDEGTLSKVRAVKEKELEAYRNTKIDMAEVPSAAAEFADLLKQHAALTAKLAAARSKLIAAHHRFGIERIPVPDGEIAISGQRQYALNTATLLANGSRHWERFFVTETVKVLQLPRLLSTADASAEDQRSILDAIEVSYTLNVEPAKPKDAPKPRTTARSTSKKQPFPSVE